MAEWFADQALAGRIEQFQAWGDAGYAHALAARFPGGVARAVPVAGGQVVVTGPEYPVNRAIGLGFAGPVAADDLATVESALAAAGLPADVEVCPLADGALLARLAERDYHAYRFMHTYLRPLDAGEMLAAPAAGIVARIATPDEADLWEHLAAGADAPAESAIRRLARACWDRPGVRGFLAWCDGAPAGAGALALRDGLAALFFMTTWPAFRRRGVQAALLAARLQFAADQGAELAVANTVPGNASQRNVLRAGFALAYTKVFCRRG